MKEAGIVHYVSGDWTPGEGHVRLRLEADSLERPQDLLIALGDVQAFVILLLVLSGKAGAAMAEHPSAGGRPTFPLPVDSVDLGEAETGETVLQLNIGQTSLAFSMPPGASTRLGQSLLAMDVSSSSQSAN
jgi:hypothetical protein